MKKTFAAIILLAFSASMMVGCSSSDVTSGSATEGTSTAEVTTTGATTTTTTEATTTTTEATTTETTISRTITVDQIKLESLLKKQPVYIKSTKYVVQDKYFKSLYPDYLKAVIMNNSKDDIKSALVYFVAWDKNNLPVKIRGDMDFDEGKYIQGCNYSDINLIPGKAFTKKTGLGLATGLNIKKFKAIVYGYETFDGTAWINPYYDAWEEMYGGGTKLSINLSTEVTLTDEDYDEMVKKMREPSITPEPTIAPKKKKK